MKNIEQILKKLRHIESNPYSRAESRGIILSANRVFEPKQTSIVWRWFVSNLESGATLALTGLCLFLILAGFSVWRSFSPLGIAQFDLAGLKAEAQAIDIQIELADLRYKESTTPIITEPRKSPPITLNSNPEETPVPLQESAEEENLPSAVTTSTQTLTIDEALLELSE